jgi:hypothetical protein
VRISELSQGNCLIWPSPLYCRISPVHPSHTPDENEDTQGMITECTVSEDGSPAIETSRAVSMMRSTSFLEESASEPKSVTPFLGDPGGYANTIYGREE